MKMIGMARLGRDVEVRYTGNNIPVANLSLAFNYGPKDQNGKREVQWIEGALWRERAESLSQYLLQGQQLYVEVRDVHVETFTRGDGSLGTKLVGDVTEIEFGAAPQGGGQNQGNQGGGYNGRQGNGGGQQRQQGNGGQNRAQGGQQRPQQGNQGGGYGNQQQSPGQRQRTQSQQQRPPANQQQPQTQGGGGFTHDASGFDSMDDDIPFISSFVEHDPMFAGRKGARAKAAR